MLQGTYFWGAYFWGFEPRCPLTASTWRRFRRSCAFLVKRYNSARLHFASRDSNAPSRRSRCGHRRLLGLQRRDSAGCFACPRFACRRADHARRAPAGHRRRLAARCRSGSGPSYPCILACQGAREPSGSTDAPTLRIGLAWPHALARRQESQAPSWAGRSQTPRWPQRIFPSLASLAHEHAPIDVSDGVTVPAPLACRRRL